MQLHTTPRLTGKYITEVLSSGWLTSGPFNRRLIEAMAAFLSVPASRIVLASSATAAFQGVLDLLRRGRGCSRVKIDDATWPGMHQAVVHSGMIRSHSACVDVVVLTDIGGRRFVDELPDVEPTLSTHCRGTRAHLPLSAVYVHDSCHSWMPDPAADFGIVSFYPTKLVPGAEGGAVVCKKEDDALELAEWLYCGLVPGRSGRGDFPTVSGRKANMTDVTAALNLEALELAPAHIYTTRVAWQGLEAQARQLGVPYRDQPLQPYLFQVVHPEVDRLRAGLQARGVPSAINFRPAPLTTVPCHRGADPRVVMETVAEVLGAL